MTDEETSKRGSQATGQKVPTALANKRTISAHAVGGAAANDALDLSFGETSLHFDKVNLLGSNLSTHAIYSLILSLSNITYLDVRGNKLDSGFGWRLIKAMKKRYLQLEICNGISVRDVRDNKITDLNLSGFENHNGLYGIEVVGAIFLAHFLRLNSSLTSIHFRRNNIQKDGAKALAQSMISNVNCKIQFINLMRPTQRTGFDFMEFRSNQLQSVNLSKCRLDDDEMVFLEEWLLRHDCVTDLDVSHNNFSHEGVRKLHRYVASTKKLKKLNCFMLPYDIDGCGLMIKAISENTSLSSATIHLAPALGVTKEKQVMMHQFAVGLLKHPCLATYGFFPCKVSEIRADTMENWVNVDRFLASAIDTERVTFWWLIAVGAPKSYPYIKWGDKTKDDSEVFYPLLFKYHIAMWPALSSVMHQCRNKLIKVTVGLMPKMEAVIPAMRYLAGSPTLVELMLLGYAGAVCRDIPPEWSDIGRLPTWMKERLGPRKPHWQALHGFLQKTPTLEIFNNVKLKNYELDSAERAILLLFECIEGAAVHHSETPERASQLTMSFRRGCDIDFALDCTRLVDKASYIIHVHTGIHPANHSLTRAQSAAIAKYLLTHQPGAPPFVHQLYFVSQETGLELVKAMEHAGNIRQVTLTSLDGDRLPILVNALTAPKSVNKLENLHIWRDPKTVSRRCQKYWSPANLTLAQHLHAFIQKSKYFRQMIFHDGSSTPVEALREMSLEEFATTISDVAIQEPPIFEVYDPKISVEYFEPVSDYYEPPEDYIPKAIDLPIGEDMSQLRKVSLCMLGLRKLVEKGSRYDEFATSSRSLWQHPIAKARPFSIQEVPADGTDFQDYSEYIRFHWSDVKVGSRELGDRPISSASNFHRDLVHNVITSLLESETLTTLDLRGNYLNKQDVALIIELLERNKALKLLNLIPVVITDAKNAQALVMNGNSIESEEAKEDDDDDDFNDDEGEVKEAISKSALQADAVRLDEGDGILFASLVTKGNFPNLHTIVIRNHIIPDTTLTFICDALIALDGLEQLQLLKLDLSNRAANLLLSACVEIAPRLHNLNGIPLSKFVGERHGAAGTTNPTSGAAHTQDIAWNDFSLGTMARIKLWNCLSWRDNRDPFVLEKSFTDVGLRGLCTLFRCAGGNEDKFGRILDIPPNIIQLDLSNNDKISDAAVAELCRTLQLPYRNPSLNELTVRYCQKLKARSSFELYHLLHPRTDEDKTTGCSNIHIVNGVDIYTLQTSAKVGKPSPPFIVRVTEDRMLSECDVHFFAQILHMFPNIPHCHLHITIAPDKEFVKEDSFAQHPITAKDTSNDKPFPTPAKERSRLTSTISASIRFFDAAPVSTRLQLSIIPKLPISHKYEFVDDGAVLMAPIPSLGTIGGIFGDMVTKMYKEKRKFYHIHKMKLVEKDAKPLYVNNINSQRLHDCFRTIYGQDDLTLLHSDIFIGEMAKQRACLDLDIDLEPLFSIVSSIDLQHIHLSGKHFFTLLDAASSADLSLLTHLNLSYNWLFDLGVGALFQALVAAGSTLVHLQLSHNCISDVGAVQIAQSLAALPRLSSINLSGNAIRESGSVRLAEAIGGSLLNPAPNMHIAAGGMTTPLHMLSMDLSHNLCRELGAMRWAELVARHPTLQFLSLANCEVALNSNEAFLALVYAASASSSLAVLDLRQSFRKEGVEFLWELMTERGTPPESVVKILLRDLPQGEYDVSEVREGIFIRRKPMQNQ
eukprot:GEMP01001206.1.p1 GENE.GEMP01001206.1~~GEMP01001206.1.p1  ORF type:complete len:1723 (+),score=302.95 GEMP01001206.1:235-5403(+)